MSKLRELSSELASAMASSDAGSLLEEYGELGLDSVMDEGLLKDVPIVGTLIALGKLGVSISDRLLVRKLSRLLASLSQLSAVERQELIHKLESDPAYGRKVGEHLLELLDRVEADRKPPMIAEVLKAYARGDIDGDMLNRLYFAIERLPTFEIKNVRPFAEADEEQRFKLPIVSNQILMTSGLTNALSAFDGMAFQPNEVCLQFLRLNLDRISA